MKRLFLTLSLTLFLGLPIPIFTLHSSPSPLCAQSLTMRDVFATMPDTVLPLVNKYARLICLDLFENNMKAEARNTFDEFVEIEALTSDYVRFRTSKASLLEMKLLPLPSVPDSVPSDTLASVPFPIVPSDSISSDSLSLPPRSASDVPRSSFPVQRSSFPVQRSSSLPPRSSFIVHRSSFNYVLCLVTTAESGQSDSPLYLEDSNLRFLCPDWTPLDTASLVAPFDLPSLDAFFDVALTEAELSALPADSAQALAVARRSLADFHPIRIHLSPDDLSLTLTLQTAFLPTDERRAVAPYLRLLRFRWQERTFMPER